MRFWPLTILALLFWYVGVKSKDLFFYFCASHVSILAGGVLFYRIDRLGHLAQTSTPEAPPPASVAAHASPPTPSSPPATQ